MRICKLQGRLVTRVLTGITRTSHSLDNAVVHQNPAAPSGCVPQGTLYGRLPKAVWDATEVDNSVMYYERRSLGHAELASWGLQSC